MAGYVIVLGAAVWPGGEPSPTLARRGHCAVDIALTEGRTVIFTGGVGAYPPSEAKVAASLAMAYGLPRERIRLEEMSRNTEENLRYALSFIDPVDLSNITIVTDRFHVIRSWLLARSLGMKPAMVSPDKHYPVSRPMVYFKGWLRESIAIPVCLAKLALKWVNQRVKNAF